MKEAGARKAALEAELAVASAPRLLPTLDVLYRAKVAALQNAFGGEDTAAARERVRALIEAVALIPVPGYPQGTHAARAAL